MNPIAKKMLSKYPFRPHTKDGCITIYRCDGAAMVDEIERLQEEVYLIEPKCVSELEGEFGITYKEAFEAERKRAMALQQTVLRLRESKT